MHQLEYLTVQDMIWMNLQVTGTVNAFDYMKLEEGTYYQYAYGGSTNLNAQAVRFFEGFTQNAPFSEGNEETAFLATLTFLAINGMEITLPPASGLHGLRTAVGSGALDAVAKESSGHGHNATVIETATGLLQMYGGMLQSASPSST